MRLKVVSCIHKKLTCAKLCEDVLLDMDKEVQRSTPRGASLEAPSERAAEARLEFLGDDFDAEEAAYVIGMDRATVLRYLRSGQMRGYRLGREWRIPRQALIDFRDRLIGEQAVQHRFALLSRAKGNRSIGTACCFKCGCLVLVTESERDEWTGHCSLCDESVWVTGGDLVERGGSRNEGVDAEPIMAIATSQSADAFEEMPF